MASTDPILLPGGSIKRIHVNQGELRKKLITGGNNRCFTVKYKGQTYWATEVSILGESRLVDRVDAPLSCGARLWIETTAAVWLIQPVRPSDVRSLATLRS